MDQQCQKCGKKFRLAILREVAGMSNYPIQSEAIYCPYCGYSEQASPDLQAENERLREACVMALETLSIHGLEDGDTAAMLRAALARMGE